MADEVAATPDVPAFDPAQAEAYLRWINGGGPQQRQDSGRGRTVVGLLGEGIAGGGSGMTNMSDDQREGAGRAALLTAGLNLLKNSTGYSAAPRSFLNLAANAMEAGRGAYIGDEAVGASQDLAAQERYAQDRKVRGDVVGEMTKAAAENVKLQTLKQSLARLNAAQGLPPTNLGLGPGASAAPAGGGTPFAANNPLNIRYVGQPGAIDTNGFAAWKTPEEGQAQTDALFGRYAEGGIKTLSGLISKWAPPSENNTAAYIANVAKATGLDPNAEIDLRDPALRAKIQAAMAVQEGNKNARVTTGAAARTGGTDTAGPGAGTAPVAEQPANQGTLDKITALAPAPAAAAPAATEPPAPASTGGKGPGAIIAAASGDGPPVFEYVPRTPPPGVIRSGALTPEEAATVQKAYSSYNDAVRASSAAADPGKARVEAQSKLQDTLKDELGIRAGRTQQQADDIVKWYQADQASQDRAYQEAVKHYYLTQQTQQTHRNAMEAAAAAQGGAERVKRLAALDDDAKGATETLNQLQMLGELSKAGGTSAPISDNAKAWLVRTHMASPEQVSRWSAQQAYDEAISRLIPQLRAGTGFQRVTDADLKMLQSASPGTSMTQEQFRDARAAALTTTMARTKRFAELVSAKMSDPKVSFLQASKVADDELGPIIKRLPSDAALEKQYGPDPENRTKWLDDNIDPGTFYKHSDGTLRRRSINGERKPAQ